MYPIVRTLFPKTHEHLANQLVDLSGVDRRRRPYQLEVEEFAKICDAYETIVKEFPLMASYNYRWRFHFFLQLLIKEKKSMQVRVIYETFLQTIKKLRAQLAAERVQGAGRVAKAWFLIGWLLGQKLNYHWVIQTITRPWVGQWVELRQSNAIRDGFLKVSSENLILFVKSHHYTTQNQEWKHARINRTDSQSINQLQSTVFTCLYCA